MVSYPFLPPRFGGQKAIAQFYKYLSREVPLVCITTQQNDPAAAEGYPVYNTLTNSPLRYLNLFYAFRLRRLIREQGISHLLIEHPYYGWLAVLVKKWTGVKLVVRSHNIEGLRWKTLGKWWWKGLWRYERWVHRQADHSFFIQQADLQYALQQFRLQPRRCSLMTYGIEWDQAPSMADKQAARQFLQQQHGIPADHQLFLFNGAFNYGPNLEALQHIIDHIDPLLQQQLQQPYTILVCGKDIPVSVRQQAGPHFCIAGMVPDIDPYFKGADLFLNPVTSGGGIKTKLVEALGNNMNAVSVENGAEGVDPALCGGKLAVTPNNDWPAFARAVQQLIPQQENMPASFYQHFYWGHIARKAAAALAAAE
ncbi:MAG: glycosyltransferase [Candidatus Pseudobacter hemicellulosilyticus]|uniref:Glycosyltransferase n=1 Tax=Candidatus Pseudobacter hemicellulosilyticus TaxID=3121375 RepID=A0AAJ6BFD1_9BACT|nr:MAG: glycosyltransferase [Pseudobacter sp.]